jgi:signal transduction histidine kinase
VGDDAPLQKGEERGLEGEPRGRADSRDEPARVTAELAARVRHEINNPLTGLIGQAQLLLRDDTLSEGARRRVEVIEQLAKRIRDAVAELRVVRNPTGGSVTAEAGARAAGEAERAEDPPRH